MYQNPYTMLILHIGNIYALPTSAKWAVHIYYQRAKSEQCTIPHINFGVCLLFCILKDIYAE